MAGTAVTERLFSVYIPAAAVRVRLQSPSVGRDINRQDDISPSSSCPDAAAPSASMTTPICHPPSAAGTVLARWWLCSPGVGGRHHGGRAPRHDALRAPDLWLWWGGIATYARPYHPAQRGIPHRCHHSRLARAGGSRGVGA